jgi:hypothetical protein
MSVDAHASEATHITVEVAYATPDRQLIISLEVPVGTTAYEAVMLSKIAEEFENIDPEKDPMGIFSRLLDGKGHPTPAEYQLLALDRVEIYRPLTIDPKQARLRRAGRMKGNKLAEKNQPKASVKD